MYEGRDLDRLLRESLIRQRKEQRSTLILNPVENIPFADDISVLGSAAHSFYNSDKVRTTEQRIETPIQFAGRQDLERDVALIYQAWAHALGAEAATLRLLSGLHAHIVLFMSMSRPGDTVLLLPTAAGGHLSGQAILERLGLQIVEMVVDEDQLGIDIAATLDRCDGSPPDFVLVDRSEGLCVEDFAPLTMIGGSVSVFDASQYLTNLLCGDHPSPFAEGFDLVVASLHKNFPGPQKALFATRSSGDLWDQILKGTSTFVSNLHPMSIYAAGLTLARGPWLSQYSHTMLDVAVRLEDELHDVGVPVVRRRRDRIPTHHIWIREASREQAFETYERLERCRIETNFRILPYSLGPGLRLGTSAVARLGMRVEDAPELAQLIASIRTEGSTPALRAEARRFNESIWSRMEP